jgi:hypothetical protein
MDEQDTKLIPLTCTVIGRSDRAWQIMFQGKKYWIAKSTSKVEFLAVMHVPQWWIDNRQIEIEADENKVEAPIDTTLNP